MKKQRRHVKIRQTIFTLVAGIILLMLVPGPSCADMIFKKIPQFQKKFGPQIMLDQALMNVNMPLDISNMPGPWKNARFKAAAVVYFMDATSDVVGYGTSDGGLAGGAPLEVVLANGSYSGTVVLPIKAAAGTITGKTCCATMVIAELGDQQMFIGASLGGTAPNACNSLLDFDIPPGTILNF